MKRAYEKLLVKPSYSGTQKCFGDTSTTKSSSSSGIQGSWSLEDKMSATKDRAGEVTQALGGAQKIVSWIPHTGQLE